MMPHSRSGRSTMGRLKWLGAVMCAVLASELAAVAGAPQQAAAETSKVTYTKNIAPVIFKHCASCHRPGEVAPFTLLTYADAKVHSRQIVAVTKSRYMPPWKPEPAHGEFLGSRRLDESDINLIERWVAEGTAEGDPSDLPPQPAWTPGWQLGQPDLIVQMPVPYELPADGPDTLRNFAIRIPVAGTRYVKAIEFRPGNRAVHHANIRVDLTDTSRRLDDQDPTPGYKGITSFTAQYPDGHFLGWTPGQLPQMSPDTAWRLEPNTDLVLELHLRPSGKQELIQAAVGLFFADGPPSKIPSIIRLGPQNLEIAAGDNHHVITDSYVLPVDVDVYAVQPHAHYLAKEVKGTATLPNGTTEWLLEIRDWDFNWQDQYRYNKPVHLPRGTTVSMEYTYDNSAANVHNPSHPPRRVTWGQQTTDEMGELWLQVVAPSAADRARLNLEIAGKMMRDDINGYEMVLKTDPDNPLLHDSLALLNFRTGNLDQAVAHFEASARLQPQSAAAHYSFATALLQRGRLAESLAEFQRTLAIDPEHAEAHNNLGTVLQFVGRGDDAIAEYRLALAKRPDYAEAHNNLGFVLLARNATDEAIQHFREALKLKPDYPTPHYNLALALTSRNEPREAIEQYRDAMRLRPDWAAPVTELAWLLATSPDAAIRQPAESVRLAERAVALSPPRTAAVLDTLAAAYAATEQFDRAISTARTALALAIEGGLNPVAEQIRAHLTLYEQGMPFRTAPSTLGP